MFFRSANLKRKEVQHHEMSANMIEHMKEIMNHELTGQTNVVDAYREDTHEGDGYTIHLGDCVIPDRDPARKLARIERYATLLLVYYRYLQSRDLGIKTNPRKFTFHNR